VLALRPASDGSADEALTRRLISALGLVDVRVLDHVVVTTQESISFAALGLIRIQGARPVQRFGGRGGVHRRCAGLPPARTGTDPQTEKQATADSQAFGETDRGDHTALLSSASG
jgi:hypothetical protein